MRDPCKLASVEQSEPLFFEADSLRYVMQYALNFKNAFKKKKTIKLRSIAKITAVRLL